MPTRLALLILTTTVLLMMLARSRAFRCVVSPPTTLRFTTRGLFRPSLDDVERISRGQAAKKRGTGSRNVPHRLNEMERREWDLSKRRRYLMVRGTGYRSERGDSPLLNIYRQLCDALAVPSISVQRGVGSPPLDIVNVDLSPLRRLDFEPELAAIRSEIGVGTERWQSLVSVEDTTASAAALASSTDESIFEQVIWRIQAYGVAVTFSDRSEAKAFAEAVAKSVAGGGAVAAAAAAAHRSGQLVDFQEDDENRN